EDGARHDRLAVALERDVRRDGDHAARAFVAALSRHALERFLVPRREHQARALGREQARELGPDALRGAGHDDHRIAHFSVSGSGMWLNAMCRPPRSIALCALAKYTACLPKRAL